MKDKIIQGIINLFKVKSLITFVTAGVFVYEVVKHELEPATVTAIIMMVWQNLFNKEKDKEN